MWLLPVCWNLRPLYLPLFDRLLFRHPFEGGSARRYEHDERPAFGDLDDRLVDKLALTGRERLLDLGCGPGTFSRCAALRHPALTVIAVDPSRDFARFDLSGPGPEPFHQEGRVCLVRAAGEALPLVDRSIDVAICLSSIRHVRDRARTFRELRRVVTGKLLIVELDPEASTERTHAHADQLPPLLRAAFGPLVLRTAPPAAAISAIAVDAGFVQTALDPDPIQPVYLLELR